jgi:hypothetical protein
LIHGFAPPVPQGHCLFLLGLARFFLFAATAIIIVIIHPMSAGLRFLCGDGDDVFSVYARIAKLSQGRILSPKSFTTTAAFSGPPFFCFSEEY